MQFSGPSPRVWGTLWENQVLMHIETTKSATGQCQHTKPERFARPNSVRKCLAKFAMIGDVQVARELHRAMQAHRSVTVKVLAWSRYSSYSFHVAGKPVLLAFALQPLD